MVPRVLKHFTPCLSAFSLLIVLLVFTSSRLLAADGKAIFEQNCRTCHRLDEKVVTGPGMKDVASRVPKGDWMKRWIKNSPAMIKGGDTYGAALFAKFNGQTMTAFDGILTDEEIDAVVEFLKSNPGEGDSGAKGKDEIVYDDGDAVETGPNFALLAAIVAGLFVLLFALRSARRNLQNTANAKKGLPPLPQYNTREWMNHNKRTVALIIIVLLSLGAKWSWDEMFVIGVYQGYKPKQPIAFDHAVHTQQNGINCEYCHSGASRSKTAGIPSASVCMNCHATVSEGPRTGTKEIQKIYDAVGWNPKTKKYENPPKPIQWVKVHNLPDFVFFSHQQHVTVGQQECKTCHGEVDKMTVARQVQPLTMGWCVNCHRETAVPGMKDNPYYEDLHKKLAEMYKGQPITVEKMGGIECVKCHY